MERKFFVRNFLLIAMPAVLVVILLGCMAVWIVYRNAEREIQVNQKNTVGQIHNSMEVIFSEVLP